MQITSDGAMKEMLEAVETPEVILKSAYL